MCSKNRKMDYFLIVRFFNLVNIKEVLLFLHNKEILEFQFFTIMALISFKKKKSYLVFIQSLTQQRVQGELTWDLQCFMRKASHKILKFFSIQKCLQSKGLSEHKPSPDFFLVSFYITGNVDKMSPYSFKLFILPIFLLQHTEMRDFMGRDSL